jgi:DNA (cytosine-5)-methyltransferase 1
VSDLKIGSLFSGVGGLDLGVQAVIGGEVVWHVEFDAAPSKVLAHHWPDVPNFGDITKVDWSQVKPIDVLTGGFPCQDVSLAGSRAGLNDTTRSGLWAHYAHAISALKPKLVVIENVRGLLSAEAVGAMESDPWGVGDGQPRSVINALGAVLGDLAGLGYDTRWCGVRAADAGAPHGRYRVFIIANPSSDGLSRNPQLHSSTQRSELEAPQREDANRCVGAVTAHPTNNGHERAGNTRGRGPRLENNNITTTNPSGDEPERWGGLDELAGTPETCESGEEEWERVRDAVSDSGSTTANTDRSGRIQSGGAVTVQPQQSPPEHTRSDVTDLGADAVAPDPSGERFGEHPGKPSAEETGQANSHLANGVSGSRTDTDWGPYRPAIERWERVLGRTSPPPTNPDGRDGQHRLAAEFVEFLMGLPAGHVTEPAIGLTRNQQLKALGNGVVPAQCSLALRMLGVVA